MHILYSTRSKLIGSFLGVALLTGAVSMFIGGQLLYKAVLSEAANRVSLDLNAAREIYINSIKAIESPLRILSLVPSSHSALKRRAIQELVLKLQAVSDYADLDFIGIVTPDGNTLCSMARGRAKTGSGKIPNRLATAVLERLVPLSGTVILDRDFLISHSPELADRARIKMVPTPRAAPRAEKEETFGMALAAAVPVFENGDLLGVMYGGVLLNKSTTIVDKVRDTVFQQEIYKGRSIGTATIFFKDLRISTNVLNPEGKRAVGTRVSQEVNKHVLDEGKKWTDRAFVVSDWYITAYEPIEDIFGERVGILYVGVLEEKYIDIRREGLTVFIVITLLGMALAITVGYFLADVIMRPVKRLIKASKAVSEGNLSPEIGPISKTEIGLLQKTFTDMLDFLKERDRRSRAESEYRLIQSEKQASVGRLAAGVAHEINNPLTGVLTYAHMLLRRKDLHEDIRSDLQTIVKSTERVRTIVKGLLDFSRQTKLDKEATDISRLVRSTAAMIENQALLKGVSLHLYEGENLPMITVDRSQIQSVLLNIILNALDATESGDTVNIYTATGVSGSEGGRKGVEITIADTGCGIPAENLDKLFDPFFTTKEVGQGTGLGLSVSLGIIQRHGGTIRVQSEVGKGTRFFVWLPIEEQMHLL